MSKKLFFIGLGISSVLLFPSYRYLESTKDSVYIPGGLNRGLRCFYNASKITFKYLHVKII